jgi:hypothetical protein
MVFRGSRRPVGNSNKMMVALPRFVVLAKGCGALVPLCKLQSGQLSQVAALFASKWGTVAFFILPLCRRPIVLTIVPFFSIIIKTVPKYIYFGG